MAFPYNKNDFTMRFCIDTYHLLFFLINGIFISDYFLSNNFERYFTSKFMEYYKADHPAFKIRIEPRDEANFINHSKIRNVKCNPEFIKEIHERLWKRREAPIKKSSNRNYSYDLDDDNNSSQKLGMFHLNCI